MLFESANFQREFIQIKAHETIMKFLKHNNF